MVGVERNSSLLPVIGHLAWLGERIGDPVNAGRLKDGSLLAYNAATMLQWRFMTSLDQVGFGHAEATAEAAQVIGRFVADIGKIVDQAELQDDTDDSEARKKVAAKIQKTITRLTVVLNLDTPVPVRVPDLETKPSLKGLMDEFLAKYADDRQYVDAIKKGKLAATKAGGPDSAINEAIAQLVWLNDLDSSAMLPEDRRILAQIVTGFYKYVVDEMLPKEYSPASKKRLMRVADSLIEATWAAN